MGWRNEVLDMDMNMDADLRWESESETRWAALEVAGSRLGVT